MHFIFILPSDAINAHFSRLFGNKCSLPKTAAFCTVFLLIVYVQCSAAVNLVPDIHNLVPPRQAQVYYFRSRFIVNHRGLHQAVRSGTYVRHELVAAQRDNRVGHLQYSFIDQRIVEGLLKDGNLPLPIFSTKTVQEKPIKMPRIKIPVCHIPYFRAERLDIRFKPLIRKQHGKYSRSFVVDFISIPRYRAIYLISFFFLGIPPPIVFMSVPVAQDKIKQTRSKG